MDELLRRLFGGSDRPHPLDPVDLKPDFGPESDPVTLPEPVTRRVLTITHNPVLKRQRAKTVREHFGWNDSTALAQGYADDVLYASYGYARYKVVERLEVDAYPVKRDGFRYDEDSYLRAWAQRSFHDPDGVDYLALVDEFDLIGRVDRGEIDEVWLFGHPYGGYWESVMAGPGAFWCNAPPLKGTEQASRRFVIMGFNFERGVGEMLEDLGHRAESIMTKVYEQTRGDANLFERFTRYDRRNPGQAEVGNVHYAPNSQRDYDWGNPRIVPSRHHTWWQFPDLSGEARPVDARVWGGGDIRQHHLWWLRHLPHVSGSSGGIAHNWWQYVIDPNLVVV